MHCRNIAWLKSLLVLTSLASLACGAAPQTQSATSPNAPATGSAPASVAVIVPSTSEQEEEPALAVLDEVSEGDGRAAPSAGNDGSVLSVSSEDPALGRADALVTLVVFGDIQCPFTGRVFTTLEDLRNRYGDRDLRIVWKHLPLPFHKQAGPAARASVAVHRVGGTDAFFCFLDELLDNQRKLDEVMYGTAAQKCGVAPAAMEAELRTGAPARKVLADQQVAQDTASRGTPNSFINGVRLSGAQPLDKFVDAIDEEKRKAQEALATGVAPSALHAHRVQNNFTKPAPRPSTARPAALPDTTVYKVPVGQSPVLGSPDALVTLVMFQDFQCPFCRRSTAVVEQLRKEFGNDLRVVFKHNPLPFHKEAMPAAQLVMEARVQKGNRGFWLAYDALFAEPRIEGVVLESVAQRLGLNMHAVRSAISNNRHRAAIDADIQLAKQLGAQGTPTFFINGRKLVGAQAVEKFRSLINEVLPAARALNRHGVPRARVYAETIKNGVTNKP